MKGPIEPRALSELYMRAVLPCLSELALQDEVSGAMIAGWKSDFTFRLLQHLGITLDFRDGRITYHPFRVLYPDIDFAFLSERHLNEFFDGKIWPPPLLLRGAWRIGKLKTFSALADRLEKFLEGKGDLLDDPANRRLYTRLNLMLAGFGLKVLAEYDPFSQAILKSLPEGLAEFTIGGQAGATTWFDNRPGKYDAGWGTPPRQADVTVRFSDIEVACLALQDKSDTMADVGLRRITVDGLVPLADGLNVVMERLRDYLEPPPQPKTRTHPRA